MQRWRSVGEVMAPLFHVKKRFLYVAVMLSVGSCFAADVKEVSGDAVLQALRMTQASQHEALTGKLRSGWKSIPFRLTMAENIVKWDFSDPPQTIQLRLGEKSSQLEESGKNGSQKVSPARFDEKVRDSDISYEDLAMRFLYWPNAVMEDRQVLLMNKCWVIKVEAPSKNESQYSMVRLWVAENGDALLQAEAYGKDGKLARRFKVISGQSLGGGAWILKQMRIEQMTPGKGTDKTPSYLEIDAVK